MANSNDLPVNAVVTVVDRATASIKRITGTIQQASAPIRAINASLGRVTEAAGLPKLAAGFANVGRSVGVLRGQITGLLGPITAIGAVATAAGIGHAIKEFADYGSGINDMSGRIGVSAGKLQEWSYAAKLAGVEQSTLEGGISKFNKAMALAASGKNKDVLSLYKKLGINVRDANGHFKKSEDLLPEVADAISRINDQYARSAVVTALFGKGGDDLLPFLMEGKKRLADLGKEARDFGIVLSDADIAMADDLGDTLDKVMVASTGLARVIAAKLIPTVLPLLKELLQFIAINKDLIAQRIGDVISDFAASLRSIDWESVGAGLRSLGSGISSVVEFIGGWKNAIIAIIALMNIGLLSSIAGVGLAVGKLGITLVTNQGLIAGVIQAVGLLKSGLVGLATFLFANPIVLAIAAAVAVIAGLVYVIYKNWDGIVEWFNAKIDRVKSAFGDGLLPGLNAILKEFDPIKIFRDAINGLVKYLFGVDMMAVATQWMSPFVDGIKGQIDKALGWITDLTDLVTSGFGIGGSTTAAAGGAPTGGYAAIGGRAPAAPLGKFGLANAAAPSGKIDLNVDFKNVPSGVEIQQRSRGNAVGEVEVGRSRRGAL